MIAAKTQPARSKSAPPVEKAKSSAQPPVEAAFNPVWGRLALGIQPQLKVSAPEDPAEAEADRIADTVMRMPEPVVQRRCAACSAGNDTCPSCDSVGHDLAFDMGRYRPATQERATGEGIHPMPTAAGARVQRQVEGDTRFRREDVLGPAPTQTGQVWKGTLGRREVHETYRGGHFHATTISMGRMTLEYDEGTCELRIPMRLVFHNPGPQQLPMPDPCGKGNPEPSAPLAADVFARLRGEFTDTVNKRLNNWYRLALEGCGQSATCTSGVEIRVVATDSTSGVGGTGPQVDVWLINADGRSCAQPNAPEAAFIYAPDGSRDQAMWGHEGAHFALHYGDEYDEAPHPSGRVQEADYSGLGSVEMSSLALLHKRHFSFAPAFVNQVMQTSGRSCRASLREIQRPFVPVLSYTLSAGGYSGAGFYEDLGFQFGVPMTRLRDWKAILGAHARFMVNLDSPRQMALLTGVRLGLEHNFSLSRFGYMLNTGVYGEAGGGVFDLGKRNELHPYGEAGTYASLRIQQGSVMPFFGVEAAVGGQLDQPGQIGPLSEPAAGAGPTEWIRFGFSLGLQH